MQSDYILAAGILCCYFYTSCRNRHGPQRTHHKFHKSYDNGETPKDKDCFYLAVCAHFINSYVTERYSQPEIEDAWATTYRWKTFICLPSTTWPAFKHDISYYLLLFRFFCSLSNNFAIVLPNIHLSTRQSKNAKIECILHKIQIQSLEYAGHNHCEFPFKLGTSHV